MAPRDPFEILTREHIDSVRMVTRLAAEVQVCDASVRQPVVEYRGEVTPGSVGYGRPG